MPRLRTIYDWSMIVQILRSEQYLGWTQEHLARELDVSVSSVSKWEIAANEPMPKHRSRLKSLAESVGFGQQLWPQKHRKELRAVQPSAFAPQSRERSEAEPQVEPAPPVSNPRRTDEPQSDDRQRSH